MLTKKLSIIQGPPGTGKTHVSVVGLRILLENKSSSDPPIIVAAQTNHALDQILRHISNFDDNYVRLGGRSKNAEVKKHTLYELRIRNNVRPPIGSLFGRAMKEQTDLARAMVETLGPLVRDGAQHPLSPTALSHLGIITQTQASSLIAGASQWVSASPEQPQDPISLWLDKQLVPFEVIYEQNNFGFEEEEKDEEYEQLKELEAEHGVDDEEDIEHLRGLFRNVEDRFTCRVSATTKAQAEAHLARNTDLWNIPERARGGVYRLFQDHAKAAILKKFREQASRYVTISENLQIGKWERDAVLLEKANVIGMTTTGFSKYRPLVSSLKPKIILIEEAAEVIEGPVTAVCVESLEHLILVGDHQQLQGHCNVKELEEEFHLNVSMFERLVRNNIPFKTLTRQRRMDPEIRRALAPIYQDLEDHPCVIGRPSVPGMGEVRSFFFDHNWSEGSDSMLSKYNEQEAEFLVGFFCYLVQGGLVPPHGITVLTFYNGQRKLILKLLRRQRVLAGEYISVNTVDSYQGEENAVVLLSLVRSNDYGNIGFLEVANRVCVAMSRARLGFYIFGNASQLSSDPLWNQVLRIMGNNPNRVGNRLPIECIKHGRRSEIQWPRDWNGRFGCNQRCGEAMECGHKCPLTCHSFPHEIVICNVECKRLLICGDRCKRPCHEDCSCSCREFGRLSENPETFPDKPRTASTGNGTPHRNDVRTNCAADAWLKPMEDTNTKHDAIYPALESGPMPRSSCRPAIADRPLPSRTATSSSSSATSDPFGYGRMSPEERLQSSTNWDAFAKGGAMNDDIMRDEGVRKQRERLQEEDTDLLGLRDPLDDPLVGKGNTSPIKNETQTSLKNGRVKHQHDYVPGKGKPRNGWHDGTTSTSNGSAMSHPNVENLIDY
jgi:helicase required for RNAi-mediated heterochromatin assembly 1